MGKSDNKELDYFKLMRRLWDFSIANPEKIKPTHIAIYTFAVHMCNHMGWKEKFGMPTIASCDPVGIKSPTTFLKALRELDKMGLLTIVTHSQNQYQSNVISLIVDESDTTKNGNHLGIMCKSNDVSLGNHLDNTCDIDKLLTHYPIPDTERAETKKETPKAETPSLPVQDFYPSETFVKDIPVERQEAEVMKAISTTNLTEQEKKAYYLEIASRDFNNSAQNPQPYKLRSLRYDAERYKNNGWLKPKAKDSNEQPVYSRYQETLGNINILD